MKVWTTQEFHEWLVEYLENFYAKEPHNHALFTKMFGVIEAILKAYHEVEDLNFISKQSYAEDDELVGMLLINKMLYLENLQALALSYEFADWGAFLCDYIFHIPGVDLRLETQSEIALDNHGYSVMMFSYIFREWYRNFPKDQLEDPQLLKS